MAKNTLPVNFQGDILNSAMDGKRRYKLIPNSDGTYSLEDATTYDQVGSNFGAGQINATNQAVNESADKNKVIQDIEAIRNVTEDGYIAGALALKHVGNSLVNENSESFNFGVKDGVRGFFTDPSRADDCFVPFKQSGTMRILYFRTSTNGTSQSEIVINKFDCIAEFSVRCKSSISPKLYVNGIVASSVAGGGSFATNSFVELKKDDEIYLEVTGSSHDTIVMATYMV